MGLKYEPARRDASCTLATAKAIEAEQSPLPPEPSFAPGINQPFTGKLGLAESGIVSSNLPVLLAAP